VAGSQSPTGTPRPPATLSLSVLSKIGPVARNKLAGGAPAKSIATSTLLCSAIFCDECDGARGLVGRGYTRRVWELQDGFRLSVGLCAICTPRFAVRLQIASESLRRASACAKVIRGAKALLFLLFRVVMFPCDRAFEDCDWAR
jgi:hypothetical protein